MLITRRCAQRQFLLRPGRTVNGVFGYCLALAAQRTGVQVHAYCVLSNHGPIILTDVRGNHPDFCRCLFELTARALNAHWGRTENLWAAEPPSVVRLTDADAQLAKTVYALTNPVAARLVARHQEWPGLLSRPSRLSHPSTWPRPTTFFRAAGPLPASITLALAPLPALAHLPPDRYALFVGTAVAARERDLAAPTPTPAPKPQPPLPAPLRPPCPPSTRAPTGIEPPVGISGTRSGSVVGICEAIAARGGLVS